MKEILVIGSTVIDMIINIDHLPVTSEDIHVHSQTMALGGCSYNASDLLRHFKIPYTLLSPIGTGMYAGYVESMLAAKGIKSPVQVADRDNGCCYCMVEASGERTFLSYHGVEYSFQKEWMKPFEKAHFGMIYVGGLEVEEPTGIEIIEYLEEISYSCLFFAPGPRVLRIGDEKLNRLWKLHPILHLNEQEAYALSTQYNLHNAAHSLYQQTQNTVIITLGEKGSYCYDGQVDLYVPSESIAIVDTIGAGDSHIGAIMASLYLRFSLKESLQIANKIAGAVVGIQGSSLPDELFQKLNLSPYAHPST